MKKGYLSEYFKKVAVKTLQDVEINGLVSNDNCKKT